MEQCQSMKQYSEDHGQFLLKDLIPAEKDVQFFEGVLIRM